MAREIVLTFDDGLASHSTLVLDQLKRRGFPGTFYASDDQLSSPDKKLMGYEGALRLHREGFDLGWHGKIHLGFNKHPAERLWNHYQQSMKSWKSIGLPRPWSVALPGFHVGNRDVLSDLFGLVRGGRVLSEEQHETKDSGFGGVFRPGDLLQRSFFVAGQNTDLLASLSKLEDGDRAIYCFHGVGAGVLGVKEALFDSFLNIVEMEGIKVVDMRSLAKGRDQDVDAVPWRSPRAVIDAFRPFFSGKTVCDLGCSRGDVMLQMAGFSRRVKGVEIHETKRAVAWSRGLEVYDVDYIEEPFPEADVYYSWPDNGPHHLPLLTPKLKALKKDFCISGDFAYRDEAAVVRKLSEDFGGITWTVKFDEGNGRRQRGTHQLAFFKFSA